MNTNETNALQSSIDKMCAATNFFEIILGNQKSKLIQFSVEFCDNYGVSQDSVDIVLISQMNDEQRRELFIEVNGIVTETIIYTSEMAIVTRASLGIFTAILQNGGALTPAGWIMAITTGDSFYALGSVVATATSQAAGEYNYGK